MIIKSLKVNEKNKYLSVGIDTEEGYRSYKISESFYLDIGAPEPGASLTYETLSLIEKESEGLVAFDKALSLLAYSDNSKNALYKKLIMRGISRDAARLAIERCVKYGYIDEQRQLERLITHLANTSLLGKEKIVARLASKGYTTTNIYKCIRFLSDRGEIDFNLTKQRLIEKRLGEDYTENDKAKLLFKHGFNND